LHSAAKRQVRLPKNIVVEKFYNENRNRS